MGAEAEKDGGRRREGQRGQQQKRTEKKQRRTAGAEAEKDGAKAAKDGGSSREGLGQAGPAAGAEKEGGQKQRTERRTWVGAEKNGGSSKRYQLKSSAILFST